MSSGSRRATPSCGERKNERGHGDTNFEAVRRAALMPMYLFLPLFVLKVAFVTRARVTPATCAAKVNNSERCPGFNNQRTFRLSCRRCHLFLIFVWMPHYGRARFSERSKGRQQVTLQRCLLSISPATHLRPAFAWLFLIRIT
jgi:hypothetical protein